VASVWMMVATQAPPVSPDGRALCAGGFRLPSATMAARAQVAIYGQNSDGPGKSVHPGAVMSTWYSYSTFSIAATRRSSTVLAMVSSPVVAARAVRGVISSLLVAG